MIPSVSLDSRELCRSSRRRSPRGRPPRRQLGVYPSGPSRLPLLQYADDRELRREMYEGYVNLASSGEYNNGPVINDIVHARARKAALLSYPDYASYMTANVMAKNPAAAEDLLMQIWRPAVKRVGEEVAEMQALADKEGAGITIAPRLLLLRAERCAATNMPSTRMRSEPTSPSTMCAKASSPWPKSSMA